MTRSATTISKVAFLGDYLPRKCGIATFTTDLRCAVATEFAQQFVDLERFNVFSKILEEGTNAQPFKGETLQPVNNSVGRAIAHVGNSRRKYAEPQHEVETRLIRWANHVE